MLKNIVKNMKPSIKHCVVSASKPEEFYCLKKILALGGYRLVLFVNDDFMTKT